MKKTLSFLLALMMVIGMMPIHAIAADVPSATITMSTNAEGDLSIGDEFTITASLTENPGYAAMTLKLKWNQSVVQFLGFDTEFNDDEEEVPKDSILGGSIVVNNEVGKITCARTKDNTKTGTLFTAKFKVVGYGECDIGFDRSSAENFVIANVAKEVFNVTSEESAITTLTVTNPSQGGGETDAEYEIYYKLDKETDSDSDNYVEYTPGSEVTAEFFLKNNTDAEATVQAYDIYLTYDKKLTYQSETMAGTPYVTNEEATSLSAIVANQGDPVTHIQLVADDTDDNNETKATTYEIPSNREVSLGKVTFKIADTDVTHGEELPITITIGEKKEEHTNISVGDDQKSYYPANGGTVKGAEVSGVYTVIWMSQNGETTIDTDENVNHGTAFSEIAPADPTMDADNTYTYEFAGWATEKEAESGTMAADLGTVTGDVTYYAAFSKTPIMYTVTYSDDGTTTTEQAGYEKEVTLPAATGKTGHTFTGWHDGTKIVGQVGEQYEVKGDVTLVAQYTPNTYTVKFHAGSNATGTMEDQTFTYGEFAKELSENTFTPNDSKYVFAGWATSDGSEVLAYTDKQAISNLTADVDLYPIWKQDVYQITYEHPEGVTVTSTLTSTYSSEDGMTLETPVAAGYTFEGWYKDAQFSGEAVTEIEEGTTGNQTFYSKWTANTDTKYTVKHWQQKTNLGEEQNESNYDLAETENLTGTTAAQVTPDVKEYKGFTAPATQTVTIAADGSTVVNYYYTRKTYDVKLDAVDGEIEGESVTEYVYGVGATLPGVTPPGGYEFLGWYDGDTKVENITAEAFGDKNLTAKYNALEYEITFEFDGGELPENFEWGENVSYDAEKKTLTYDITDTVNLPAPTKEYYTFTEWKVTTSDGNWSEGSEIHNSFTGKYGNATLTAQWSREAVVKVEEYKYAFKTVVAEDNETSGYRMIRVDATNVADGKEYKFNGKSMYYIEDANYAVDGSNKVFYTLIPTEAADGTKYIENNALTEAGYDLLTIGDVVNGNRATITYDGDVNGDGVLNVADANVVYQMVINGGAYYTDNQLDIEARLKADMSKTTANSADHRGSIDDVNVIVNKINGVKEAAN